MLFHVSVEADDPRMVAEAIAELWNGQALPFPPVGIGSWCAVAGDDRGTMIEIYQRGTEMHEGASNEEAVTVRALPRRHGATHVAIGTRRTVTEIFALAHRYGWRAKLCRREDRFGVVELWVEGCLLVEVLTPEMQREYCETMHPDSLKQLLAAVPEQEAA